ncbi:MAG: hypothetical protein U0V04_16030 [Spirosomataceae bacterium]
MFATRLLPRLWRGAGAQTGRSPPHAALSLRNGLTFGADLHSGFYIPV